MSSAAADAIENGWNRLQELLQTPEDLAIVEQLRARTGADKASKDAALKTVVRAQLDSVLAVRSLLGTPAPADDPRERERGRERERDGGGSVERAMLEGQAVSTLGGIQENLRSIDTQVQASQRLIPHYHLLRVLFYSHRQLHHAWDLSSALTLLPDRIYRLKKLVREESNDALRGRNLLRIHKELFELEALRDTTLASSNAQISSAILLTLETHFASVDEISAIFQGRLRFLARNLLALTKSKSQSTIIKLLKIIEVEERADQLVAEGKPRKVKNARQRFFEEVSQSIDNQFDRFVGGEEDALAKALEDTDFIQEHLTMVYDDLVPCFPPSLSIFEFYLESYHRNITELLDRFLVTKLSPRDILTLFRWVEDYYFSLRERLGIPETALTPKLLEGQREKLDNDYLGLVRDRVGEWARNIMLTEARDFRARKEPPEVEDEGKYGTASPVILFQMLNQQIDIARTTTDSRLLARLSSEFLLILTEFQRKYEELVEREGKRYLDFLTNPPEKKDEEEEGANEEADEADEVPGGLVEYLMAAINVQFKCSEFTMQLTERFKGELKLGEHIQDVEDKLNKAENGFRNCGKLCIQVLLSLVFYDLGPVFQDLFTPRWLEGRLLVNATATLGDYCRDFHAHLCGYFFNKLMYECLDKFLQCYVEAMFSKTAVLRPRAEFGKAIDADTKEILKFFSSSGYLMEPRVNKSLTVLRDLRVLLTCEPNGVPAAIESLKEHCPDVQAQQLDKLLLKRTDLSKDAIAKALESVGMSKNAPDSTADGIFSKVAASISKKK